MFESGFFRGDFGPSKASQQVTAESTDLQADENGQTRPQTQNQPAVFLGQSAIHGMGYWTPEQIVTAAEIESQITTGLSGLDLEQMLGMSEKRVCPANSTQLDISMYAVDDLLKKGTFEGQSIDLETIDMVLYFGVVPEHVEPATAMCIANQLGLKRVIGFDVSDACLGFTDAWMIADSMIGMGRIRNALLVSAERSSMFSDIAIQAINNGEPLRDHYAALSLGDGSCAVLVGAKNPNHKSVSLLAGSREGYSEHVDLCILPSMGKPMVTRSSKLLEAAVSKFPALVFSVLDHVDWTLDELDFYVAHQASLPVIKLASQMLNVPFDKSRNTMGQQGNMASVSVPFTLAKALEELPEWKNQKVLQLAFGSGLGIGVFALECS